MDMEQIMRIFGIHPKPWKVEINPFGKKEGDVDNIFIFDTDGYTILIVSKHPVWNHMENERVNVAQLIVDLVNRVDV